MADLQPNPPVLRIYGKRTGKVLDRIQSKSDIKNNLPGKFPTEALLVQLRSNLKTEGKGMIRNIIEMGDLLKTLAAVKEVSSQ